MSRSLKGHKIIDKETLIKQYAVLCILYVHVIIPITAIFFAGELKLSEECKSLTPYFKFVFYPLLILQNMP
jgi:hypothetical protein